MTRCFGLHKWRRSGRAIVCVLLVLAAVCIWWQRESIYLWVYFLPSGRTELPAFDRDKAALLSVDQRVNMERELFTELFLWNRDSRRYNGLDGLRQREQRWREMAREGFELAHLTLTAFEPSAVRRHSPLPALRRLDALARQGDAGAMCLIAFIADNLPRWGGVDLSGYHEMAKFWMLKAADAGHPECLVSLGARLLGGSDGFSQDSRMAMEMLVTALRKEYMSAASVLAHHFLKKGLDDALNRRLVYCWSYHAAKYRFSESDLSLVVHRNAVPPAQRESLDRELVQLRQWHPVIDDCLALSY